MSLEIAYRLKIGLTAALACAAILFAGGAALTLTGQGELLHLAQRDEDVANAALALPHPDLDAAESRTWSALSQAPATASAWARLAYIDHVRGGRLSNEGLDYLDRTYEVAPLGPDITPWRVRFAYENWALLTPSLRRKAMEELRTYARYRGQLAHDLVVEIQSPPGRLAAAMMVSMGREDARLDWAKKAARN